MLASVWTDKDVTASELTSASPMLSLHLIHVSLQSLLQLLWIIVTTLYLCPPSYLKHVKFFVLSTLSGVVVLPNSFSVLILMVSNICVNAAMKLDKEMATHSSVLAWRIPGMGEPGGLPSMGSCRVRHDWSDLAAAVCEVNVVNTFNSRIFFKEDLFFISKFDLEVFNTRNKLQTSL